MWLSPESRLHPGATPLQFTLYRIVLGLVVVFALAAAPTPDVPSQEWLDLPRGVRGGLRFSAGVLGLALVLGILRRAVGPLSAALAAILALYGHTSWGIAVPLVVHGVLVAGPASGEPFSLLGAVRDTPIPSHWTTAAWVSLALVAVLHTTSGPSDVFSWLVAGSTIAVVGAGLHSGPRLTLVLPAFALLIAGAWLSFGLGAAVVSLLPGALGCITHDWLPPRRASADKPIVFFDGVCAVCDRGMQLVMAEDQLGTLQLAPLQGETSKKLLNLREGVPESMIVYDGGQRLDRSAGAVRLAEYLGGVWWLATLFGALPLGVREGLYDWVASNRYDWFGKLDACRIPSATERERFLD